MSIRTDKLLAFMTEAPEGKYTATKPTDEQLATVLPYIVDKIITWSQKEGHCDTVEAGLFAVIGGKPDDSKRFYNAAGFDYKGRDRDGYDKDGYDRRGYDRDGYNRDGYDYDGFNAAGYNHRGFNKDGFNVDGVNRYGRTREDEAALLVGKWSKEYVTMVATKLAEREAAKAAEAAAKAAAEAAVPVEETDAAPVAATV